MWRANIKISYLYFLLRTGSIICALRNFYRNSYSPYWARGLGIVTMTMHRGTIWPIGWRNSYNKEFLLGVQGLQEILIPIGISIGCISFYWNSYGMQHKLL